MICQTCTQEIPVSYCTECNCLVQIPKAEKEIKLEEHGIIYKLKCTHCDKWFIHAYVDKNVQSSLSSGF